MSQQGWAGGRRNRTELLDWERSLREEVTAMKDGPYRRTGCEERAHGR